MFESGSSGATTVNRFGHADTVSFKRLNALDTVPDELQGRPTIIETPEWTVFECRDAQLVGPEGLTFLRDGSVLLENSLGWTKRVAVSSGRTLLSRTLPVRRDSRAARSFDSAVSLVGPWTDNYYHWHLDYLARLAALAEYTEETGRQPPLILPPETSSWMREALVLAGYDDDDWIVWDGRRTNVGRLIVPALPRETEGSAPNLTNHYYSLNHDSIRWLDKRMHSNVSEEVPCHAPVTGRIFVSRQGTDSRRVTNIDRLNPLFDEYGFERFRPEEYPVAEQVRTFTDADVVLGAHGAGLTNFLFAKDATLIELFGAYVNPVFYALAVQTGNNYTCAQFESGGKHLHVDTTRLRKVFSLANIEPIR
jgi:hypothetical protein